MWRMSAPPLRRCVATLWRKVWQVTCFLTPAFCAQRLHDLVERRAVEDAAARRDEEPLRSLRRVDARAGPRDREELRPAAREVALDRARPRAASSGTFRSLPPLPQHDAQRPLLGVDVEGRELDQLARADAGRVERLEDRAVAQRRAACVSRGASTILPRLARREDRPRQPRLEPRPLEARRSGRGARSSAPRRGSGRSS